MVNKRDWKIIRKSSEKDYQIRMGSGPSKRSFSKIQSVLEGRVVSRSGYLAVCEMYCVDDYLNNTKLARPELQKEPVVKRENLFLINPNSNSWALPKIMQVDGFVTFSNLYGDGIFAVLSSENNFYILTDCPTDFSRSSVDSLKAGSIETHNSKKYKLEGFVGIGSGRTALVDPEIHKISYSRHRDEHHEIACILKVKPGNYKCKFIDDNKKLSVRRVSD